MFFSTDVEGDWTLRAAVRVTEGLYRRIDENGSEKSSLEVSVHFCGQLSSSLLPACLKDAHVLDKSPIFTQCSAALIMKSHLRSLIDSIVHHQIIMRGGFYSGRSRNTLCLLNICHLAEIRMVDLDLGWQLIIFLLNRCGLTRSSSFTFLVFYCDKN